MSSWLILNFKGKWKWQFNCFLYRQFPRYHPPTYSFLYFKNTSDDQWIQRLPKHLRFWAEGAGRGGEGTDRHDDFCFTPTIWRARNRTHIAFPPSSKQDLSQPNLPNCKHFFLGFLTIFLKKNHFPTFVLNFLLFSFPTPFPCAKTRSTSARPPSFARPRWRATPPEKKERKATTPIVRFPLEKDHQMSGTFFRAVLLSHVNEEKKRIFWSISLAGYRVCSIPYNTKQQEKGA